MNDELSASDDAAPAGDVSQRPRRSASPCGCVMVLLLIALVIGFVVVRRPTSPPLTRDRFELAYERWRQHGPASYDIAVRVSGRQAAVYQVEVRHGTVVSATRNDLPLRQSRTLDTWRVEGMFDTMEADLLNVERHEAGRAEPTTPRLILRCRFHPELGYPAFYQRTELRDVGSNYDVAWEVIEFVPISPARPGDERS